jgi:protein O-mannosyl-transferase
MPQIHHPDHIPKPKTLDKPFLCLVLLTVICTLINSDTILSPFILDDDGFILNDKNIRVTKFTIEGFTNAALYGHPPHRLLPNLSFAINYYIGRYDVVGYHLVNIAIHLMTSMILFFFFKATLSLIPRGIDVPGQDKLDAFFAALLWMVHPIATQSVTYICQRMTSMATLFYILALFFYMKARIAQRSGEHVDAVFHPHPVPPPSMGRGKNLIVTLLFSGCIISGLAAVASKENAAMLLIFILTYEWFFFQDLKISWSAKKLIWIFGAMVVFCVIALIYLGGNPLAWIEAGYARRDFTPIQRIMTEWRVVVYYVSLFFFPIPERLNLEHDYPLSYSLLDPSTTLPGLLAILSLIAIAIKLSRKDRLASFCILWFLGNLVIESSIFPIEIIFEHRTYLPFIMTSLMAVIGTQKIIRSKRIAFGLLCGIIALFSVWTYQRNTTWQDELSFYRDCVEKSPGKFRPHNNLGIAFYNSNQFLKAIQQYQIAIQLDPDNKNIASTFNNIGNAYLKIERVDEAMSFFKQALDRNPTFASAHINMGTALIQKNRISEAIDHFSAVLKNDPINVEAHINMGLALARSDHTDEAILHYETALRIFPYHPEIYNNIGVLFVQKNRIHDARICFLKALELKPDYASAKANLEKLQMLK